MPPQLDTTNLISDDEESFAGKKNRGDENDSNKDSEDDHSMNGAVSYWDAPVERSLVNKTLSQLDLSVMECNNPDDNKEKRDSYWEQEHDDNHPDIPSDDEEGKGEETACSYWDDHQPVERSLQGRSLSQLDLTDMTKQRHDEDKQNDDSSAGSTSKSHSFWDWRVETLKKTVSQLSLRNLTRGSSACDEVVDEFDDNGRLISDSGNGPITNKVHKLRSKWRNSFRRLSQGSLRQLDEPANNGDNSSSERKKGPLQRRRSSKRMSFTKPFNHELDFSNGSHASQRSKSSIGEDAFMF